MPFFSRNPAFSLFYLDEGPRDAAATILLIAGLSCDMHDWSWQVPYLLFLGLRVISVDGRGQGRSSAPAPTAARRLSPSSWPGPEGSADPAVIAYYPHSNALDVIALFDHLSVKNDLVVMSHSLGRRETSVAAFAGRLKCPRLTFGSNDWYVETDRTHMPRGHEKLDEVVVMEGMGHWFHQLESEEFNAHLARWLGKIGVLPVGTVA